MSESTSPSPCDPGHDPGRDPWNPAQYDRFQRERSQPFFDLMALVVPEPQMRVLDLGCGTGALTRRLAEQLRARETLGVDRSPAMLERCAEQRAGSASLSFQQGDLAALKPDGSWDLVFSNAALHWVEDHPALLRQLKGCLAPGGQLAVQVPANHEHPSQTVAAEVARKATFAQALGGYVRRTPVLSATDYAHALHELGFADQHVMARVYAHELPDREAVLEWLKGTTLTDYERRMPAELYQEYLGVYRRELAQVLADSKPFFFPFQRILFWARLDP